jgi:two-component system, chemotaxis family, sensor kinase CheA
MAEQDPYRYFRIEAAELVERLGQGALAIGRGEQPPGGVAALLRHAHTLKGAARVVRQIEIADHAHAIEDVLSPHRSAPEGAPEESGAALLSRLDAIGVLVAALSRPAPAAASAPAPASTATRAGVPAASASAGSAAAHLDPAPAEPPRAAARARSDAPVVLRAEVSDVEAVVEGLAEALVELEALQRPLGAIQQARQLSELLGQKLSAPRRADPEKLAALLDRSERVTQDLKLGLGRLESGVRHGMARLRRQLEQTHGAAERLRLVPAGSIFTSLERAAQEAGRELGRALYFTTRGGDVKLDAHVLAITHGALLHVVRNAVAHGLEPQAERVRANKPARGSIELEVGRQGRDVVFTCRDDGAGVDCAKARRVLAEREPDAAAWSDEQVLERLLAGGVSTSDSVTLLSGRGVGLDVVREAAAELGGSARLRSTRGQGATLELRVPLSIAAVTVVAVEAGGKRLSIPLDGVRESVRYARADIGRTGSRQSVCHEGRVLPFAPLAQLFGAPASEPPAFSTVLILAGSEGYAAVGVERLLGTRTAVVRPLPDVARASPIVAGATLDALGNPELVLDTAALASAVERLSGVATVARPAPRPILVIDDSLTTRMLEQSILESAGYEVALATSAEEGLEKARQSPYALFLVDVEMPGIDGFTFIERTRREPALAAVPAVLVSSRSEPEDLARGAQVGASGYIVKGRFDQRELLGLIERLVEA